MNFKEKFDNILKEYLNDLVDKPDELKMFENYIGFKITKLKHYSRNNIETELLNYGCTTGLYLYEYNLYSLPFCNIILELEFLLICPRNFEGIYKVPYDKILELEDIFCESWLQQFKLAQGD